MGRAADEGSMRYRLVPKFGGGGAEAIARPGATAECSCTRRATQEKSDFNGPAAFDRFRSSRASAARSRFLVGDAGEQIRPAFTPLIRRTATVAG